MALKRDRISMADKKKERKKEKKKERKKDWRKTSKIKKTNKQNNKVGMFVCLFLPQYIDSVLIFIHYGFKVYLVGWLDFYGILSLVGYLMPNPICMFMICKRIFCR